MMRHLAVIAASFLLISCSDNSADRDGDGAVNETERAAEMASDAFIPMKAGRWETEFTFTEIAVPTLGKAEKRRILEEISRNASSVSCLSEAEARKPGADFFGGKGAEKCVYQTFDVSGQKVQLSLRCGMEGTGFVDMELDGSMEENAFSFDTQMAMRLPMVGKVKLNGTATGKHAGACTGTE